jgi:DNA-binding CsgD family transcriptional regulator
MGRVDTADHARLGRFVAETGDLPANGEPFSRAFLAALRRLVPCDFVGYAENDKVRCRLLHFVEDPIYDGPEPESHLSDMPRNDPVRRYLADTRDVRARRLSDVVRRHELRRSQCYAEWFGTVGVVHQLCVGLDAPPWHTKRFAFDRGPGRDFTARDRAVLDVVRPHLAARYALWRAGLGTPAADGNANGLTVRELEVLNLVAEGMTNGEIAQRLWISPGTVRRHLENIYEKLDVHTRTAAVAAARR